MEWGTGGHQCLECRQAKGTSSKYRELSDHEKVHYADALAFHKENNVKKMAKLCDNHLTPSRIPMALDKSGWDGERQRSGGGGGGGGGRGGPANP